VFAVNQQVALFFASGLRDGSGSALTNALVFWQLPFGIFAASITTVLFPAMSRQHARGDTVALSRSLETGLRGILLLLVPSGIGLAVLGNELIAVALQRGAFMPDATVRAATVLSYYSIGLFSVGAFTFLQRGYYACDNYRTPLRVAVATVILDVALSLWLKETPLGVAGLALANSIAFTVGMVLYIAPIRKYAPDFSVRRVARAVPPALLGSGTAVLTVLVVRDIFTRAGVPSQWWARGSSLGNFGLLALEALPAIAALVGIYRLFGLDIRSIRRGDTGTRDLD
jgi:putative peptidoglycan lipid II flippase